MWKEWQCANILVATDTSRYLPMTSSLAIKSGVFLTKVYCELRMIFSNYNFFGILYSNDSLSRWSCSWNSDQNCTQNSAKGHFFLCWKLVKSFPNLQKKLITYFICVNVEFLVSMLSIVQEVKVKFDRLPLLWLLYWEYSMRIHWREEYSQF